MFVYKGDGCTARYTIRFRHESARRSRAAVRPGAGRVPATARFEHARNVASVGMFDHVAIAVADLAASERFYRTVLSVLGPEPSHADAERIEWDDTSCRRTASTR